MTVIAHQRHQCQTTDWHEGFLKMLPAIARYARLAFRQLRGEAKDDAVGEVIANCVCAYHRLFERRELHRAFASVLVRYAVALYYSGRRVGTRQCSSDLGSILTRRKAGVELRPIGTPRDQRAEWMECLIDSRRMAVPDQAHFRVEFPRWLSTRSRRDRCIAEQLSLGHSTQEVALKLKLSSGRISQIRRELGESWAHFSGEEVPFGEQKLRTDMQESREWVSQSA